MFRGGFQTIFDYLKIIECFGRSRGLRFRYNDTNLRSLSLMAGMPIFAKQQGSQKLSRKINYYNPKWIQWATKTLIPPAKSKLLGVPVQTIYAEVFQRFVRVTAYTYLYLQQKNRWEKFSKLYSSGTIREKMQLRASLRPLILDGYGPSSKGQEGYHYHAGHAATFWMRRALDSTHKEVWEFFQTVLSRFDPKYLPSLAGRELGKVQIRYKVAQGKRHTLKPQDASNLPGLLRAATPGTIIRLTPGTYTYSAALLIQYKANLILEGTKKGAVRIQLTDPHKDVFDIRRSNRIVIRNIMARHSPQKKPCKGSVVSIRFSKNVTIRDSVLDGSGSIGVYAVRSSNIQIQNNHIHNNSWQGLYLSHCKGVKIFDNLVEKNKSGLTAYHTSLVLKRNTFRSNGK